MPVSSINAGIASGQSLQKGAMAQRAYQQELTAAAPAAVGAPEGANASVQGVEVVNVFSAAPIGSQTGVAAYTAMMRQSTSSSMRIEA